MFAQQGVVVQLDASVDGRGHWMIWKPQDGSGNDATGLPQSAEGKVNPGDKVVVIFKGPNQNYPVFGVLAGTHLYTHDSDVHGPHQEGGA